MKADVKHKEKDLYEADESRCLYSLHSPVKEAAVFSLPHYHIDMKTSSFLKITMTEGKKLTKDDVKKKLNELIDLDYFMDACVTCGMLHFLQKGEDCSKSNCVDTEEECQVWKDYRDKMKPIVVWKK